MALGDSYPSVDGYIGDGESIYETVFFFLAGKV